MNNLLINLGYTVIGGILFLFALHLITRIVTLAVLRSIDEFKRDRKTLSEEGGK